MHYIRNRNSFGGWALAFTLPFTVAAGGLNRDGIGARSMALAGSDGATASDALSSMGANPAGLAHLNRSEIGIGLMGGIPSGDYQKGTISKGSLNDSFRTLPEAAFASPMNDNFSVGLSFVPDSLLLADWSYVDAPGGLGGSTSYGLQEHRSELILLRSALGAAVRLHPKFSLGASVGLLYNQNRLVAPYIFQDLSAGSAGANGAKTLLDLKTDGFGWNIQFGAIYAPLTNLQFGLTYKSEAKVSTDGDATGDPYAQFGVSPGPLAFHYDANVENTFPHEISGGATWSFLPRWRIAFQVDWKGWSDAFRTVPVRLDNGDNISVNGVLGSSFQDNIPLAWNDQFTYRTGLEYSFCENFSLRGGYSYGRSPVPDSTLTPLTAVIMEHMVSAGFGYAGDSWSLDLAWQYDLPVTREVNESDLLSGEYSNSAVEVSIHRVALTCRHRF